MESLDGRIVVMRPGSVAAGTVIRGMHPHKPSKEMIAGHSMVFFVARGEGTFRIHNQTGILRPNTLIAAPAGLFSCELHDPEIYMIALREPVRAIDDKRIVSPFIARELTAPDAWRWKERMADLADRAQAGRIDSADIQALRGAIVPYVWQRESNSARQTLSGVFATIWDHIAEPLTIERLATDVGYTPNYLNDLTREHTGRTLGTWIADFRMARARAALEYTDLSIAEVGAACGYDDPAYFSRAFRRAHGVPPATWRIAMHPVDARHAAVTVPLEELHAAVTHAALPGRTYSFAS